MKPKLYFFTATYPYTNKAWITNELLKLKDVFDVIVIPSHFYESFTKAEPIDGIKYEDFLLDLRQSIPFGKRFLRILTSRYAFIFLLEFFKKGVFLSKAKFFRWIGASYKMLLLARNERLKKIFDQADENTIFYFYWARETSEILGLYRKTKAKIVVRFHGYDLYEYRFYNYMPYRDRQLKNLDWAIFISEDGEKYLRSLYKNVAFKSKVFRLGIYSYGKAKQSNDGIFRLVSCSSLVDVKRVHIIAQALQYIDFPIHWTHIGGGEELDKIKAITKDLPKYISVKFTGTVPPEKVFEYYVNQPVDLFVNVSSSEGIPVSIMEAFASAIPVYATDVGGTHEIVNSENGKLLNPDITPEELAKEIREFRELPYEQKERLRQNAYKTFQEKYNFEKNSSKFVKFLLSLVD